MESNIRFLAKLHNKDRGEIISCLRKTAIIHDITPDDVFQAIKDYTPKIEISSRKSPVLKGPTKSEIEEVNLRLTRRARDIWEKRYINILKQGTPSKIMPTLSNIFDFLRKDEFYSEQYTEEMLVKLLTVLIGHKITESSIRIGIATILVEKDVPIKKVISTIFSKKPTEKEMIELLIISINIKQNVIERLHKDKDIEQISAKLMTIGTQKIKNAVVELI